MPDSEKAYSVSDYGDNLKPGEEIKINHRVYSNGGIENLAQLTNLPTETLQAMREDSVSKEKAIYSQLREGTKEWEAQAGNTCLLDMAIQYTKTQAVKHSSNKWEKDEYGDQSISNMVYKMYHRTYEETKYNRENKEMEPVAWQVTWALSTNSPVHQAYRPKFIAGQERKRFTDKAAAEKYIAGRIKAHSHFFTEISPPIPPDLARSFEVNGVLLPGYRVEGREVSATVGAEPARGAEKKPSVIGQIEAARRDAKETAGEQRAAPSRAVQDINAGLEA